MKLRCEGGDECGVAVTKTLHNFHIRWRKRMIECPVMVADMKQR